MKILYIANLVSPILLKEIQSKDAKQVSHAVQKFSSLIVEGLMHNNAEITVVSPFFLSKGKLLWHHKKEIVDNVTYHYVPSVNFSLIRYFWLILFYFCYVFAWGLTGRKNKALICDVLNGGACTGAIAAARLLGIRILGLMTDMPGLMVPRQKSNLLPILRKLILSINRYFLKKYTHYVFLAEKMNEVNIHKRPYIVMEGLVKYDSNNLNNEKKRPRTILYAGGLHARYGLQLLIDAVKSLPQNDIKLILFGNGPLVEELVKEDDPRIEYCGIVPNEEIVEAEKSAVLLVNPRPTHEDFTQYSFPSKNMEYMVSGTPLLTTMLPGMPKEYNPYVYLFDQGETVEGYARSLNKVLSLPEEELRTKGKKAREWVMTNKNHIIQTKRIIDLFSCE